MPFLMSTPSTALSQDKSWTNIVQQSVDKNTLSAITNALKNYGYNTKDHADIMDNTKRHVVENKETAIVDVWINGLPVFACRKEGSDMHFVMDYSALLSKQYEQDFLKYNGGRRIDANEKKFRKWVNVLTHWSIADYWPDGSYKWNKDGITTMADNIFQDTYSRMVLFANHLLVAGKLHNNINDTKISYNNNLYAITDPSIHAILREQNQIIYVDMKGNILMIDIQANPQHAIYTLKSQNDGLISEFMQSWWAEDTEENRELQKIKIDPNDVITISAADKNQILAKKNITIKYSHDMTYKDDITISVFDNNTQAMISQLHSTIGKSVDWSVDLKTKQITMFSIWSNVLRYYTDMKTNQTIYETAIRNKKWEIGDRTETNKQSFDETIQEYATLWKAFNEIKTLKQQTDKGSRSSLEKTESLQWVSIDTE